MKYCTGHGEAIHTKLCIHSFISVGGGDEDVQEKGTDVLWLRLGFLLKWIWMMNPFLLLQPLTLDRFH